MARLITALVACLGFLSAADARDTASASSYIIEYGSIHSPVISRGGMVVSQNLLASHIGAQVLEAGGNAIDAAVATGLALAVTLPRAGNLGGGGFMLVHLAASNETIAIDYYGQAPAATVPGMLLGEDGRVDRAKRYSFLGVTVPGTPLGLHEAHRRFGRLQWADLVQPALDLAEQGMVVTEDKAYVLALRHGWLGQDPASLAAFYDAYGAPHGPGDTLVQADLAWSLRQLRDHGPSAFYTGEVAEKLIAAMQANGGVMTLEDLANYQVKVSAPLWTNYRGHRLALMPPPSSGVLLGLMMNMLGQFDMAAAGAQSAQMLHLISETTRLVYADRSIAMGGYPFQVPVEALLDPAYAAARAGLIPVDSALSPEQIDAGLAGVEPSPDTTHFSVVDACGNAVSNTYTLGSSFGAHVMAPGTGFLLNNVMGNFRWDAPAGTANAPEPGKRAISTITPVIVFRNDQPWLISGTPGGLRIIPIMAQFLVNRIDFDLNIAEATARPRAFRGFGENLEVEPGISPDTIDRLESMGHLIRQGLTMGSVQSIEFGAPRLYGAPDTRRPGAGVGITARTCE